MPLASLDGREGQPHKWKTASYAFNNGTFARGYVKLAAGFSIPNNGLVTFDVSESVEGVINMHTSGSGTLTLDGPLTLAPGVTIPYGGNIDGQGNAILLEGDLTIPANKVLQITSDTLIDGRGNTLYLEDNAQVTVDSNVTLSLKNMRVKNVNNDPSTPMISCNDTDSRLALQNVELALGNDFYFNRGHLFIHDDVIVSGMSSFVYGGVSSSFIDDGATWVFDKESTFYYAAPGIGNLIHMQSKTASMYFDGSTLQTTDNGLKLSKGSLFFDNRVLLNSAASAPSYIPPNSFEFDLIRRNSLSAESSYSYAVEWSPDGRYVAVDWGSSLRIYKFTAPNSLTLKENIFLDTRAYSIAWHPSGQYVAVGMDYYPFPSFLKLMVFRFNQATGTLDTTPFVEVNYGNSVDSLSWHPNGEYLAVGGTPGSGHRSVEVYRFNPSTGILNTSPIQPSFYRYRGYSVSWHPDGDYLVAADFDSLVLYNFNPTTGAISKNINFTYIHYLFSVAWHPGGLYLAIGGDSGTSGHQEIELYSFNPTTGVLNTTPIATVDYGGGTYTEIKTVSWHPGGGLLGVGGSGPRTGHQELEVYSFDVATGTLNTTPIVTVDYGATDYTSRQVQSIAWRPDGVFFAMAGTYVAGGHQEFEIYSVVAGMTNYDGIIFGDSSLADGLGDLDVRVLGGARVEIEGKVTDDSVG